MVYWWKSPFLLQEGSIFRNPGGLNGIKESGGFSQILFHRLFSIFSGIYFSEFLVFYTLDVSVKCEI